MKVTLTLESGSPSMGARRLVFLVPQPRIDVLPEAASTLRFTDGDTRVSLAVRIRPRSIEYA